MSSSVLKAHSFEAKKDFELSHKKLGTIQYNEEDIIFFAQGILGFDKKKRYILVERESYLPFIWMISIDDPDVDFLLADPSIFLPSYKPNVSRRDLKELEIEHPQRPKMYVIVTLKQDIYQSTSNLSGPILLNAAKKLGKQLVLLDDSYSTKHRILRAE